ncbi:MAG: hypothetical protein ACTSYH_03480 [Candidatus Heimdallarchaeaceae archaeon]
MNLKNWNPPRMWEGKTAFILGGGPSLLDVELGPLKSKRVIGVNNAFELGDWVDVCWFGDCRWFNWNKENLQKYKGLVATCCKNKNIVGVKWVKYVERGKAAGIDERPGKISWNSNSGASAINLAYHFGVKRIVLLGFDMHVDNDGNHNWHDKHKSQRPKDSVYATRFMKRFPAISYDAKRLKLEILNATEGTALPESIFPHVKLEEVL